MVKKTTLVMLVVCLAMALPTHAGTTFVTNTGGNAAALEGAGAGNITALTLFAADGGGTINVSTIGVFLSGSTRTLGMDDVSMGVENAKWGATNQQWLFSFDQTVDFDALGFGGSRQGMELESVAWKDDANASGANWSFTSDGSVGKFAFWSDEGPTFDFTSAGVSSVAAGTQIAITHVDGGGGAAMTSFTITPVPEPATMLLLGLGGLVLRGRRRA